MSKVLTIQRSKWRRGGFEHDMERGVTALLNEKGFMCCLGFDALACGITTDKLLDQAYPSALVETGVVDADSDYARTRTAGGFSATNAPAATWAIKHNDNPDLLEDEREALIREDLKALGWDDVVFVD